MGKLVDHFGPKRMWSLSAVVQGALFLAWPFIDSFPEYVALAVAMEVAGTLGGTAHGAYVIDILPPSERVESRAYMYSALNVGFSIGAFLGAGAIAFGADALRWGPLLSAVLFMANSLQRSCGCPTPRTTSAAPNPGRSRRAFPRSAIAAGSRSPP